MSGVLEQRLGGVQTRAATIEAFDPDEGTILLRAVPYDVEAQLEAELFESFGQRAFRSATEAPHRVKFYLGHTNVGGVPIGHAKTVDDKRDGVWVRMKMSNTASGLEAGELAADGTLDEVSVEFRTNRQWWRVDRQPDGLHVKHSRAHLLGVALVPHGAYGEAAYVAQVRGADEDHRRELALAHLRALTA